MKLKMAADQVLKRFSGKIVKEDAGKDVSPSIDPLDQGPVPSLALFPSFQIKVAKINPSPVRFSCSSSIFFTTLRPTDRGRRRPRPGNSASLIVLDPRSLHHQLIEDDHDHDQEMPSLHHPRLLAAKTQRSQSHQR